MIVDERMRTYINSLDMGNTPFLEELEQYAIRERVPIIRREMQSFIKMFLAVTDNVLQEGDIIESHYLVERRNRTIYKRMREYLYELKHNPSLITSIIPLGDGVTVSVKQE